MQKKEANKMYTNEVFDLLLILGISIGVLATLVVALIATSIIYIFIKSTQIDNTDERSKK